MCHSISNSYGRFNGVAAARYADSLGVTGATAEAINQSILSANAKMADITSQVRFLFSAQTLPKALHILIALLYAIFPFMLVVVAIRGYPEGLKVLYYFAGGMLSMELIKMFLAIVHNLVSYITAVDGATLLHAASVAGNNIDYDKVIHGHKYYQYMAEQATLAADIGTATMFMIPMVIATGQVKLLGSALGGAVSAHAPNQGIQGSQAEMAKANDAENRNMDSVVAGYSTAAVMKGIEENNAAIAALSKMDNFNDYNKGQVAQQMQQIGSTAGFGGEFKNARDFRMAKLGGQFQGIQSAAQAKSLGEAMDMVHNFRDKMTDGAALARTLGNDAAAKTIGSARGLLAGDFFDRDGNLKDNREGNLYTQGLENQARISANQTAGVGKLGEFTREQMNAIQYGAEAGALGQIAQGNALRAVHGTGQAFQDSYSKTAYMNAHQSLSQQKGSAQAYDSETHGGDIKIAESMGRVNNATALRGHQQAIGMAGSEADLVNSNVLQQGMQDIKKIGGYKGVQEEGKEITGSEVIDKKGMLNLDNSAVKGGLTRAGSMALRSLNMDSKFESSVMQGSEKMQSEFEATDKFKEEKDRLIKSNPTIQNNNKTITTLSNSLVEGMPTQENVNKTVRALTNLESENEKERERDGRMAVANLLGKEGLDIYDAVKNKNVRGAFARMSAESLEMALGDNVGNFNVTSSGSLQGSVQSGVSFSHNESRNYSFGTNISGGSAIAGAALSMGMSASTYGAISSGVAAAGQIAAAAAMVLPGGAMGKGLANMGLIGGESGYAMGMGAARAANSKNAASAVSSANAYMDKLGSFNTGGGLGQLKANYELAERGFNNIALSGSPREVMNARMAMDKARKAYNKGLATQNSLSRQYNALSPQARKHVDKELGGNAGGVVEMGVGKINY